MNDAKYLNFDPAGNTDTVLEFGENGTPTFSLDWEGHQAINSVEQPYIVAQYDYSDTATAHSDHPIKGTSTVDWHITKYSNGEARAEFRVITTQQSTKAATVYNAITHDISLPHDEGNDNLLFIGIADKTGWEYCKSILHHEAFMVCRRHTAESYGYAIPAGVAPIAQDNKNKKLRFYFLTSISSATAYDADTVMVGTLTGKWK